MNKNPMSKKFRSRMVRSGVLASAGYGLLFGACAEFVAALTCWLLDVRAVWLPLSVGLGVALVAGFVTFFVRFRPNDRRVAHRMDSMGLEERTVTMMELEKDDSPIAKLQREDTVKRVSEVTKEQINRSFPLFVIRRGVLQQPHKPDVGFARFFYSSARENSLHVCIYNNRKHNLRVNLSPPPAIT